jgi:hypothetical protein
VTCKSILDPQLLILISLYDININKNILNYLIAATVAASAAVLAASAAVLAASAAVLAVLTRATIAALACKYVAHRTIRVASHTVTNSVNPANTSANNITSRIGYSRNTLLSSQECVVQRAI